MHEAAGPAARPAQTGGVAPTTPATSAPASATPTAQAAPVAPAGQPQNLFQVSTLISFSNGLSSIYV
jgi:UV excision repair protein RAD23